jgi:hypothetical protein
LLEARLFAIKVGGKIMKRLILNLGTIALLATAFWQAGFKSAQPRNDTPLSYRGEIMDGTYAGQGSHNQEVPGEDAKASKDCGPSHAKDGSKLVLYNSEAKTFINLDDQDKARDYAGKKVAVVGTYDGPTKTIHIQTINAAP